MARHARMLVGVTLGVALLVPLAPPGTAGPRQRAVEPEVVTADVRPVPPAPARTVDGVPVVAQSSVVPVTGFGVVGVAWDSDTAARPESVSVRTRTDGRWSDWTIVPVHDEHAPDGAEAEGARAGSDPIVVGEVDDVQVRVAGEGEAPADAEVVVVDPGRGPADATVGTAAAGTATAAAARPQILTRADWGADESKRGAPTYGTVRGAFVHHTVNANNYAAADVPSIIRGIYAFHVNGRGWKDVGYNFLVDRFGRVWEGRYGGVDRAVVGAHTAGYNDVAFAMSAIGNFETVAAPDAVVDAYGRLFAWKLGLHGVTATGTTVLNGRTFQKISGHRDAASTACPGRYLYERLPAIRSLTASYQATTAPPPPTTPPPTTPPPPTAPPPPTTPPTTPPPPPAAPVVRDLTGDAVPDLATVRTDGSLRVSPGDRRELAGGRTAGLGGGWNVTDVVLGAGDLDGDGRRDVVARERATGLLFAYHGDGSGGWRLDRASLGGGWSMFDLMAAAPDLDGNGRPDVLGRDSSGTLWLYSSDGAGWWAGARRSLGTGWNAMDAVVGAGDLDGDGRGDLVAREAATGVLWLYRGDGAGGIAGSRVSLGTGWDTVGTLVGPGDWDGDGRADLLARGRSDGALWLYPGDGRGGWLSARRLVGTGWNTVDLLASAGDSSGDGQADVLARGPEGTLWLYPGQGARVLGADVTSARTVPAATAVVGPGDWDGDGRGDVLTVDGPTGELRLHRGDGTGRVGEGVAFNTGWGGVRAVTAAGDLDRDGRPDLLAIDRASGTLFLYRGDGRGGFLERRQLRTGWGDVTAVVAPGRWDADAAPDVLARLDSGSLRFHPGDGSGGLLGGRVVNSGWQTVDPVVGVGDLDGDGAPEILAREAGGDRVWLYLADGAGGVKARRPAATGWASVRLAG
ncbi:MAG TPA: FG-GAP-like repeat-containing protein [Jiangellales bacterium]|nr:FG-GAP-like repeat-containing protein [Jiangellales bacterium]